MAKEIILRYGAATKLRKEFKVSAYHVRCCLKGVVESDLSDAIREYAVKNLDGQIVKK